jgi:16S rRNA processing protein RimM
MAYPDHVYLGYFSRTRGLKGELQLFFEFEDYEDLPLESLFVEMNGALVPYFVEQIKFHPNSTAFLFLEDQDHVDKVQELVRKKVYYPTKLVPARDPDDFRWSDLKGFQVIDEVHGPIGLIQEVHDFPHQYVASVDFNGNELMFPLNEDLIVSIIAQDHVLEVHLPEGLVDLYKK